jgi:D-alanyl-D-alanine dipeptidase
MKTNLLFIPLYLLLFVNLNWACELEEQIIKAGLIDIKTVDSTFKIEILNATENNILGINSYGCLSKCYLRPEVADKLFKAQQYLRSLKPGYSLKLWEGVRPRSIQRKMFEAVKGTGIEKYVANPEKGSMHNFGTAVDVTIIDGKGIELDMGKPDPKIKIKGKSNFELKIFMLLNHPNKKQKTNRDLLKKVMMNSGFFPISYEWWHFDAFQKEFVRTHYKIIE